MLIERFAILVVIILITIETSFAQTSISATDWKLQQILQDQVNHQNRVKTAIGLVQPKIQAAIADLQPNAAFADLVTALQNANNFLTSAATVNDYVQGNAALTCTNLPLVITATQFSIRQCYSILVNVNTNATQVLTLYNRINVAFLANTNILSDSRKQAITSILTSLYIVYDEYYQYGIALVTDAVQYNTVYAQLLYCKNYLCNCPSSMPSTTAASFAIIDNYVALYQSSVVNWESQIQSSSAATLALIQNFLPSISSISDLNSITTSLQSLATLISGYVGLSTNETVRTTTNCDDANFQIAFIQHKLSQYYTNNLEAQRNATFVLYYLNLMNAYYYAKYYVLNSSQQSSIQGIATSVNALLANFRQYVLSLVIAWTNLNIQLVNAKLAIPDCVCTPGTGTTPSTTTATTSTTETTTTPTTTTESTTESTTTESTTEPTTTGETTATTTAGEQTTVAEETTVGSEATVESETTVGEEGTTEEEVEEETTEEETEEETTAESEEQETTAATTEGETSVTGETTETTTEGVIFPSVAEEEPSARSAPIYSELCSASTQMKVPLKNQGGEYLKTACVIMQTYTQPDALTYCTTRGMKLLVINSTIIQTKLMSSLTKLVEGIPVAFRIDGLRNETGDKKWYFYSYGKTPAFNGLSWLISNNTLPGFNSLVVTNTANQMEKVFPTFKVDGWKPNYLLNVLCEFK